jgi:holo-[acyl-carrier protein] synthase
MIVGLGADVVEIERIGAVYRRHGERFLRRILTEAEREYVTKYRDPTERLAGRWAAKEAAMKALGCAIGQGVGWRDIEVVPDALGKPLLRLYGGALKKAGELGVDALHVTISHSRELAIAQVILEKR